MVDEILQKLIEFFENASPVLWGVLIKQVHVEAFADFAWGIVLVVISGLSYKVGNHYRLKWANPQDNDEFASEKSWCGYSMSVVCAAIAFGILTRAIMRLINPEFYAIQYILQQISGG